MTSRNPSSMLSESLADFSKAAHQIFTDLDNQARQEIAHAVAEAREARAERDRAMKDLRLLQLESQSWKEDAASSKAALAQAKMTIATQAQNLVNHLETITQLRRELNQWKDQARNWQDHFLRVEEERCAHFSRIDEFIIEKLEKFQYATRSGTSSNAFMTPKSPKKSNQIDTTTSTLMMNPPPSPQPPAYRPNAESDTPEVPLLNGTSPHHNPTSANVDLPPAVPESGSKRPKPKLREVPTLQGNVEKPPPNGRKPRKSNDNTYSTATTSGHSDSLQQTPSAQSNVRATTTSTVIRRVHAVINVKAEEDDLLEESGAAAKSSRAAAAPTDAKRRNEELQGNLNHSRRRLVNRRSTLLSDNEQWSDEESREVEGSLYKLRKTSKIDYREEDDNDDEEDELMMGGADNLEIYEARPVDQSRQKAAAAAAPPKKKRKYSLR